MSWEALPEIAFLVVMAGGYWRLATMSTPRRHVRSTMDKLEQEERKRRDQPKRDAERLEVLRAERENYLLLRKAWQPVPGSPLDWSLGLSQDQVQAEIAELEKRVKGAKPKPPTTTSATSRGRSGDGQNWTQEADRYREQIEQFKAEQARYQATKRMVHELQVPPTTGRWTRSTGITTDDAI